MILAIITFIEFATAIQLLADEYYDRPGNGYLWRWHNAGGMREICNNGLCAIISPSPNGAVTIPNWVESIGIYAFMNCSGMTSVTIPDSIKNIGDFAFLNCSGLSSVTIPGSVTNFGEHAFYRCSGLASVTIGNGVSGIRNDMFQYCYGIKTVTMPCVNGLRMSNLFPDSYEKSLRKVTLTGGGAIPMRTFEGCTTLSDVDIRNGVTSIGNFAFDGCSGLTSVTIPNSITSIGSGAFRGCRGLTKITIPDGVPSIGDWTFDGCDGLTSIAIPNSVTNIGRCALSCKNLESVTIGKGVTRIGEGAFYDCRALKAVYITDIAKWCGISFDYSANPLSRSQNIYLDGKLIVDLAIPDGVTSIGAYAFNGCSGLTSVTIPDSVTNIGYAAFRNLDCSGLTNVTMGSSVASIGSSAFEGCSSLTSVMIPDSVTSIGDYAFTDCSGLTSVTIPDSVTNIGDGAFNGCSGLTDVAIGKGVTNVGDQAFSDCNGLTNIIVSVSNETYMSVNGLLLTKDGKTLISGINGDVIIPESVTSIEDDAFSGCSGLTSVMIPDSVTNIGFYAFNDCSGLTNVTIGNGVNIIMGGVFAGCSGLTNVTIPSSVTHVDELAFRDCSRLTSVMFLGQAPSGILDSSSILSNANSVRYPRRYADSYEAFVPASKFGGYVPIGPAEFLNMSEYVFTQSDERPWGGNYDVSHDGEGSMRSGKIANGESTWFELDVNGTGRLSFWWKASSEAYDGEIYDFAYLSVDGVSYGTLDSNYRLNGVAIGGKTGWTNVVFDITGDGPHTIRWTYRKDEIDEFDVGEDCVWLDQVSFIPLVSLSFNLGGGSGLTPDSMRELAGTSITLPSSEELSWVDHVFDGWSDGNADYAAGANYVLPSSNVTLTAKWIAKRSLAFTLDGGTGEIPAIQKYVPGTTVMIPTSEGLSKSKHRFVGWSDGINTYGAGEEYVIPDSDIELAALWEANTLATPIITSADVTNDGTIETASATINIEAGDGTVIYYTLDGTVPTTDSTRYTAPFVADGMSVRIRAIAVKDNYFDSQIAEFSFTRKPHSVAECLNVAGVTVSPDSGDAAWGRVLGEAAHDGVAAMRSGAIGDGETSSVEMTVVGAGEIGFWWKSSSEISRNRKFDYVSFLIDGEEQSWLGGVKDWTNEVFSVTGDGTHTFRWVYQKNDNGQTQGEDCAWLDEVTWIPGVCVVDASITGGKAISINTEWVTTELDQRFGAGRKEAFIAKFGNDLTAAFTKKTGKVDGAGNELSVWHDYVAGTDPTDTNSTFKVKIEFRDGIPVVEWEPNLNESGATRDYTIYGKESLSDEEWMTPTNSRCRFFKVGVAMPGHIDTGGGGSEGGNNGDDPTPVMVSVTFDANGGTGGTIRSIVVNEPIGTLPTPTWDGYTFNGWFTATNGGTQISVSTTVTTDVTYYAQWTATAGANSHEKVQLWEGGPYWATTNIGAERPEDYGYYFWWGDTVGYKRENDVWVASDGSSSNFSFTTENTPTDGKSIAELKNEGWITADEVLAPEHDAAQVQWGSGWRMPTKQEIDDLNGKCSWTRTKMNGVNGFVVRGKDVYASNSIFLPFAGYGTSSTCYSGGYIDYWSSVPSPPSGIYNPSWYLRSFENTHNTDYGSRYYGYAIRPVQGFSK